MHTTEPLTRRRLLGLTPTPARQPGPARQLVFQPRRGPAGDVLVCIFLRGGADGLHLIAPCGDEGYYRERPRLAVPRPDDRRVPPERRGVELDGFFALNPKLAPLLGPYRAGRLAVAHAVGSPDRTHSHFEAMATMECGAGASGSAATGWLGRHLQSMPGSSSPLRALALGDTLPRSLDGALGATAVPSLDAFRLAAPAGWSEGFRATLAAMYEEAGGPLRDAGRETIRLLQALERLQPDRYRPERGAHYPTTDFGRALAQIAQLVKAELGLEVACLDLGGWDSHISQDSLLDGLMTGLASGLAAFDADLRERMDRVTVVVMTEFGRRVRENGGLGTDHGQGTCFLLLGDGIRGGRVIADWPGLHPDQLDGPGDLRGTIDYRDLLAEVVARRLRNPAWRHVFPELEPEFRAVCHG
jgi:uncharacterized protein (DUF1501 family)